MCDGNLESTTIFHAYVPVYTASVCTVVRSLLLICDCEAKHTSNQRSYLRRARLWLPPLSAPAGHKSLFKPPEGEFSLHLWYIRTSTRLRICLPPFLQYEYVPWYVRVRVYAYECCKIRICISWLLASHQHMLALGASNPAGDAPTRCKAQHAHPSRGGAGHFLVAQSLLLLLLYKFVHVSYISLRK